MNEDWGDNDYKPNWKRIIILALIGIIATASVAVAVYKITSPPSAPVHVAEPAALSAPTFNSTNLYLGETLQITVVLSTSVEGQQVFFYENGTNIGSALTNSAGQAILNRVMNVEGTYIYTADAILL